MRYKLSFFIRNLFLTNLTPMQIFFIVAVSLIVLITLILLLYFFVIKKINKKNFRNSFYKRIYSVAQKNDYYLVNNFSFRVDKKTVVKIDHILFGEKYIYVILDRYYNHGLTGQINDSSLISLEEYGKKSYVDNPILENHYLVRRLSAVTSIAESMFIGIVLVNNECDVSLKNKSSVYFLCQKKRFASLIKEIESREIGKMNAEELDAAVQGIAKLNRRKL